MDLRTQLNNRLSDNFTETDVERLLQFGEHYRGKVRGLFIGEQEIIMVTTDRL